MLISLRSMRVGLLTRMMGIFGIVAGVLFLIPLTPLPVVQALWLIFFGAMLLQLRQPADARGVGVARGAAVAARAEPPRGARRARARVRRAGARARASQARPAGPPVPRSRRAADGPSPNASKKRKRRR